MIIWDKRNGYIYEDEQTHKRFSLLEAKAYDGEATSDIVVIWDEKKNCFADYVYGATFLHENIAELDNVVSDYVADYEAKQKATAQAEIAINYKFTKAGVKAFLDGASTDFFEDMDNGGEHLDQFDVVVSCGKHQIRIPLGAEQWNGFEIFLNDAIDDWDA